MAISRNTKNLQLKVWGTKLPNTYGEEYLQSINGDTQNSSFKLIDDWAGTVNAIIGTSPFATSSQTLTSAINELHTRTNSLEDSYIKNIKVNGTNLNKVDNSVSFTIPTKTSEIENDSHIDIETNTDISNKNAISFGDSINIVEEVIRDENGHVTQVKSVNSTFPLISTSEIDIGDGNAVTSITVNNGVIRGLKEKTFATIEDLNNSVGHTHDNKEYLDKIGEDTDGSFTYNGNKISGGGTGDIDIKLNDKIYSTVDGSVTLPNLLELHDNGVVEGGQYLDFHVNGTNEDYDARIYYDDTTGNFTIIDDRGSHAVNKELSYLLDTHFPIATNFGNYVGFFNSDDLDEWKKAGMYSCLNITIHTPISSREDASDSWGFVIITEDGHKQYTQFFRYWNYEDGIYIRHYQNDSWGNWYQYIRKDITTNAINETITVNGITDYGQFRVIWEDYGFIIRTDEDSTHFLLTNQGDAYGMWNGLRPITIKNSTGEVLIENVDVVGEIENLKNTVVDGKTSVANAINDKLGTTLSNQTSFADMATYINSINHTSSTTNTFINLVTSATRLKDSELTIPYTTDCTMIIIRNSVSGGYITLQTNSGEVKYFYVQEYSGNAYTNAYCKSGTLSNTIDLETGNTADSYAFIMFEKKVSITVTYKEYISTMTFM